MQMITWAAGNADLQPLYSHAHAPIAACVLGASFVFILGMVLINLLVSTCAHRWEEPCMTFALSGRLQRWLRHYRAGTQP